MDWEKNILRNVKILICTKKVWHHSKTHDEVKNVWHLPTSPAATSFFLHFYFYSNANRNFARFVVKMDMLNFQHYLFFLPIMQIIFGGSFGCRENKMRSHRQSFQYSFFLFVNKKKCRHFLWKKLKIMFKWIFIWVWIVNLVGNLLDHN